MSVWLLFFPLRLHARRQLDFENHVDDGYLKWICQAAVEPAQNNVRNLLSALTSCSRKRDLQEGRRVHTNAVESGNDSNIFVAATIINMYAKCGSMGDAQRVFDSIREPNVVAWTALIQGYAENGEGEIALDLFSRMKTRHGCLPNSVTYLAAIKACTSLAVHGDIDRNKERLKWGREMQLEIGCHLSHFVQNALIDMYSKCGSMNDARSVFDSMQEPDVVSWNALILGYADNGKGQAALDLFSRMKNANRCVPESMTYVAALKACTSLAADGNEAGKRVCLEQGRVMHLEVGHYMNLFLQNSLIDMYSKCGSMEEARRVFDGIRNPDVVSWTSLIAGYTDNGQSHAGLKLFLRMKATGYTLDSVTYVAAIKACTSLAADGYKGECLKRGREIHLEIEHHMVHIVQNSLIDMYAKCGSMVEAQQVFDTIKDPDVVSWTALIVGYVDIGQGHAALDLFSKMKTVGGCSPDSVTYVAALKACRSIGALAIGRKLHSEITNFTVHVVTCLVDFYAKCGSMIEAHEVFASHSRVRNITTWNALLQGYGNIGDCSVFVLFKAMQDEGHQPDAFTFMCMLSYCSHSGLVEKARDYLEVMLVQYGVTPEVMHYNCMVDVLGRSNQLDEAVTLLRKMPCNPDTVSWMAILGACRKWENVEIGRWAFQSLVDRGSG